MVSEIRVFLVVSLAIDVNFMEIAERCSDTSKRKAQLEQREKEQGDHNDRNECEGNFSYIGHRAFTIRIV